MMSNFEKEDRYIVIKLKNLTHMQEKHLRACLYGEGIQTVESVVVEHDWPEYHMVWSMLKHRMAGKTVPDFDIWRSADALQQRLTVAEQRLSQVEGACDLAMSAIDDDERGANFVKIIQAIKVKAALKPAEAAAPIEDQWEK